MPADSDTFWYFSELVFMACYYHYAQPSLGKGLYQLRHNSLVSAGWGGYLVL